MDLMIIYDKLEALSKEISSGGSELIKHVDELIEATEGLKSAWKGADSDIYCTKLIEYLNKIKDISTTYGLLADTMVKSSTKYKECDEKYSKEVKGTVV